MEKQTEYLEGRWNEEKVRRPQIGDVVLSVWWTEYVRMRKLDLVSSIERSRIIIKQCKAERRELVYLKGLLNKRNIAGWELTSEDDLKKDTSPYRSTKRFEAALAELVDAVAHKEALLKVDEPDLTSSSKRCNDLFNQCSAQDLKIANLERIIRPPRNSRPIDYKGFHPHKLAVLEATTTLES